MNDRSFVDAALSKVPAVTLGFWIIKILATTLGETGGDTVTMTWLGETTPHPVPIRLSDRDGDLRGVADRLCHCPDQGAQFQSLALLGDHRCLDHVRDHACRFRRPLARDRLPGRLVAAPRLRAAVAVRVVARRSAPSM